MIGEIVQTIQRLWATDPGEWDRVIHICVGFRLFTQGDRKKIENYRTLWLISVVARILARIVPRRLQRHAESRSILPSTQWGLRSRHSTLGAILVVRLLAEMAAEICDISKQELEQLLSVLIDIENAYPSVPTSGANQIFKRMGWSQQFRGIIHGLHRLKIYKVKANGGYSREFKLQRGFLEGDPSSPLCYNVYHSNVLHHLRDEAQQGLGSDMGVEVRGSSLMTRLSLVENHKGSGWRGSSQRCWRCGEKRFTQGNWSALQLGTARALNRPRG